MMSSPPLDTSTLTPSLSRVLTLALLVGAPACGGGGSEDAETDTDASPSAETGDESPSPDNPTQAADDDSSGGGGSEETGLEGAVAPLPGDLVITELMIDVSGDDDGYEWFEIENVSAENVSLDDLSLVDLGDARQVAAPTDGLVLEPGARLVFAERETPEGIGDAAIVYYGDSIGFDNEDGGLSIRHDGDAIDSVEWSRDEGWPVAQDMAMALSSDMRSAVDNDYMESWCAVAASPGAENAACGDSAAPEAGLVITEIMPSDDGLEWLELRNTSDDSIRLHGLVVVVDGESFTIEHGGLEVPAGGRLVLSSDSMEIPDGVVAHEVGHLGLGNRSAVEIRYDGQLFDAVSYDDEGGWLVEDGRSLNLDPARQDTTANDSPLHWCLGDTATPGADNIACAYLEDVPFPEPGELHITELMVNAPGNDDGQEWIELYNAGANTVRLDALVVETSDGDRAVGEVAEALQPGGYAVLAQASALSADLPDALLGAYGDISLDNDADTVRIRAGETVVAELSYDAEAGWPLETGASLVLTDAEVGGRNNSVVASWCASRTEATLLASQIYGTPGVANETCIVDIAAAPSPGELVITEFVAKVSGEDNGHEWVEIHNTADSARRLNGVTLSTGDESHEIDLLGLEIPAGGYAVLAQSAAFAEEYGGTAAYLYGEGLDLANQTGAISLSYADEVLDQVVYDDLDPMWLVSTGYSTSLHPGVSTASGNDVPLNWCLGWTPIGVTGQRGTPGEANDACPHRDGDTSFIEDAHAYDGESGTVVEMHVSVDPADLAVMNAISTVEEKEAHTPVPIVFSTEGYPSEEGAVNATMTLRGQTSVSAPQKSWKLNLEVEDYQGQGKIHLSKHTYDVTRIREQLGARISREVENLPSLRVQWVNLFVNGEDYGLFTQEEHLDEMYLRRRHFDERGALFKASDFAFRAPTLDELAVGALAGLEAKTVDDYTGVFDMLASVHSGDAWGDVLAEHFVRENIIDFVAVAYLTKNLDTVSQNFYIYAAPTDPDRFYFIPWDFDGSWDFYAQDPISMSEWEESFGNWWGNDLWYLMLQDSAFLADVQARAEALQTTVYSEGAIQAEIAVLDAIARPYQYAAPDGSPGNQPLALAWRDDVVAELASVPGNQITRLPDDLERPMPFHTALSTPDADSLSFTWSDPYDRQGDALTYSLAIAAGGCGWRQHDCFDDGVIVTFEGLTTDPFVISRSTDLSALSAGDYQYLVYATDEAGVEQVSYGRNLPPSFTLD